MQIQKQLPDEIAPREYDKALQIVRGEPLVTLLYKEVQRYNVLLSTIKQNLSETLSTL